MILYHHQLINCFSLWDFETTQMAVDEKPWGDNNNIEISWDKIWDIHLTANMALSTGYTPKMVFQTTGFWGTLCRLCRM